MDSATTYTDDNWQVLGANTVKHDPLIFNGPNWYPGLFYVGKNYMPALTDFEIVEPGVFFISATVYIQGKV